VYASLEFEHEIHHLTANLGLELRQLRSHRRPIALLCLEQWHRRKGELQAILKEFKQDTEGTVEELRGRLTQFANQPSLPTVIAHRLAELNVTLGNSPTPDSKPRSRGVSPASGDDNAPSGSSLAGQAMILQWWLGGSITLHRASGGYAIRILVEHRPSNRPSRGLIPS